MSKGFSKICGKWWVIVTPSGHPLWWTSRRTRPAAIKAFKETNPNDPVSKRLIGLEYKCVPLQVSHFYSYRNRQEITFQTESEAPVNAISLE